MFRVLTTTAWLWGYVLARYIIWSHRWEGIMWYPNPNASSWYALTNLKYKPKSKQLPIIFFIFNITMSVILIICPESLPIFFSLLIIHILSALWWPAFIELKYSWRNCFIMACCAHGATVYLFYWSITRFHSLLFCLLPLVLIIIQSWMVWISGYAYLVIKEPTLLLQYTRRESRNLIHV